MAMSAGADRYSSVRSCRHGGNVLKEVMSESHRALFLVAGAVVIMLLGVIGSAAPLVRPVKAAEAVPLGSTWSYFRATSPPATSWRTGSLNWPRGSAPFGFGRNTGTLATALPRAGGSQPLSSYFRTEFTLHHVPTAMSVTTWADDGVVLYLNGIEIGRANVPASAVSHDAYATAAPSSSAARSSLLAFTVPLSAIRTGANFLAAHVLSNWRETHNVTFDAQVVVTDPRPAPPPSPRLTGVIPGWGAPSWSDEFSYRDPKTGLPAVDPANWNVRGRNDLGLLFDAAVVRPEKVTVDHAGRLHIRADWLETPVVRPSRQSGIPLLRHETGYLDQRRLQKDDVSLSQRYGRWEIRAKVPSGPKTLGALSAFWLRNGQSGEIDIMEAWGYDEEGVPGQRINTATTTVHTHTSNPSANEKYVWHHSDYGGPVPVWSGFHSYAFELTPKYAAVIVDGIQLVYVTPATHPSLWNTRYFGSPLHMRLNLHVGPSARHWGLPDPNRREATANLDFQVDYVRMWSYRE